MEAEAQPSTSSASTSEREEEEPKHKRAKIDLVDRVNRLEEASRDAVTELKEKVRMLALQSNPSDALMLLTVEELAQTARRTSHADADMFEELSRQALKHQSSINISSLILSVVGSKASDVVVKALAKCVKEKQIESKINDKNSVNNGVAKETSSRLANLYPPMPGPVMMSSPGMFPMATYGSYGYQRPSRGMARNAWKPRGRCFFCDSIEHTIRFCPKIKAAKQQDK